MLRTHERAWRSRPSALLWSSAAAVAALLRSMRAARRRAQLWPNRGFTQNPGASHGQQDRDRSRPQGHPPPAAPTGVTVTTQRGQKVSLERGSHTRSKKNPGKRAKKGG